MSMWHTRGVQKMEDGTVDFDTDQIDMGLATATYVADMDDEFVDDGGADDALDGETAVGAITGYTAGHQSASRKALANLADTIDDTENRLKWDDSADYTWDTLGAGATITQGFIHKEGASADTDAPMFITLTWAGVATNGGNFTVAFHADGIGYDDMG